MSKLSTIFFSAPLNYRRVAKSHKPSGKTVDLSDDTARIYKSMRDAGKESGQPWQSNEVVSIVSIAFAGEHLATTLETIAAEIADWPEDDSRRDWYTDLRKITHVAVFGHCRQLTLVDVISDAKLDWRKVEIPIVTESFSDAGEFFRCQLHENEAKNVGILKTTLADKVAAMYRAIKYGRKPRKESDITAMLGCNRGMSQKLWALWLVGDLLTDGHNRLVMERPKGDDGKVYVAGGYVPIQLDREELMRKDGGILFDYLVAKKAKASGPKDKRDDLQKAFVAIEKATIAKLETLVAKTVSGKTIRIVPAGKKDWQVLLENTTLNTFQGKLSVACIDGKLEAFVQRYEWLFSLKVTEVDRIGASLEAESEAAAEVESEATAGATVA